MTPGYANVTYAGKWAASAILQKRVYTGTPLREDIVMINVLSNIIRPKGV
jgi:hypothetical protein